jgi:hypothetical protein
MEQDESEKGRNQHHYLLKATTGDLLHERAAIKAIACGVLDLYALEGHLMDNVCKDQACKRTEGQD